MLILIRGLAFYLLKSILFPDRLRTKILFLFGKSNAIYRCRINKTKFLYCSPKNDALNKHARTDFINWENLSRSVWRELSKSAVDIVDAGSYTGIYAIEAAKANSRAKVYAYEPTPSSFFILSLNVYLNKLDNIYPERIALGDTEKTSVFFTFNEFPDLNSFDKINKVKVNEIKVAVRPLDALHQTIDLIKADVEGSELDLLIGCKKLLEKCNPTILIEFHGALGGSKISTLLQDYGYTKYVLLDSIKSNYLIWHDRNDELVQLTLNKTSPEFIDRIINF
jgi:FkbM family methyltransferase